VTLQQRSCGPEQAVASSAPILILRRLSRPPGHGMDPRVKPEDDEGQGPAWRGNADAWTETFPRTQQLPPVYRIPPHRLATLATSPPQGRG
jgi:hypothetical protein